MQLWKELAVSTGGLSEEQLARMNRYLDLLLEANQTMNLTRITDRAEAQVLHVADALTLLAHLPAGAHRLADLGSGGGVPGVVLAIARPDAQVMLVESTRKKAAFLERTAGELGLGNLRVLAKRIEEVGHSKERESFDVVTARAVGTMPLLLEWGIPLLKKGGKLLAMKGQKAQEELANSARAMKVLNVGEVKVHAVTLPGTEHHVIVEVSKIGRTDPKFPRTPTETRKRPL